MPIVRNKNAKKIQLGNLKPGNTFRTKWDSREGFYIVAKTNSDPSIQTPSGKVLAFNIKTGRAIFKPMSLTVEAVKIKIHVEDEK